MVLKPTSWHAPLQTETKFGLSTTSSLVLQPFLRPVGGCVPGVGGTQMRGSSCIAGRRDGWLPFGLEAPLTNLLSRCPSVSSGQLCASLSSPDTYIWARPLYSQSQTQPPHTICYFFVCESKSMPQYDQMCVCISVTFSVKRVCVFSFFTYI